MWFDVRTFEFAKDQASPETVVSPASTETVDGQEAADTVEVQDPTDVTEEQEAADTVEVQDPTDVTEEQEATDTVEGRAHPKSEDAFGANPETGIAAVADGASNGMFSGPWAKILVKAIVEGNCPEDPTDTAKLTDWLKPLREQWHKDIPALAELKWHQKQRLQECGGGYTTLLWIEKATSSTTDDGDIETSDESDRIRFLCHSVGDCCLFHIRNGVLLQSFPISDSNELDARPITICSVNRSQDELLTFKTHSLDCCRDDLVVLATDAIAKWLLEQQESNLRVDWDTIWSWSVSHWQNFVGGLRAERDIRHDDTTLVMLKILAEPTEQPSSADNIERSAKVELPETPPAQETREGGSAFLQLLFCVAVVLAAASGLFWLNR